MVAIASKQILVIDQQRRLGERVVAELESTNQPVLSPTPAELPLGDRDAVVAYFKKHQPVLVIHRPPALLELAAADRFAALENLVTACRAVNGALLHLSDYHVFGDERKNAYVEDDSPAPLDQFGAELARWENGVREGLERHLILRLSWLIELDGDNLLTRILSALMEGRELALSKERKGAPTWDDDALRVICGVARQILAGADNWGNFHYCSSDRCTEWEFGQEVMNSLSELREFDGTLVAATVEPQEPREPASAVLNCRRILNNFGVHGRTWRQGIKARISQWLERNSTAVKAKHTA